MLRPEGICNLVGREYVPESSGLCRPYGAWGWVVANPQGLRPGLGVCRPFGAGHFLIGVLCHAFGLFGVENDEGSGARLSSGRVVGRLILRCAQNDKERGAAFLWRLWTRC